MFIFAWEFTANQTGKAESFSGFEEAWEVFSKLTVGQFPDHIIQVSEDPGARHGMAALYLSWSRFVDMGVTHTYALEEQAKTQTAKPLVEHMEPLDIR